MYNMYFILHFIHIILTKTCVSVSIALESGSIEKFKDNVN